MTFRRRQFFGWGVLSLFAAVGAVWLLRLDYAQKISSDVLDLIPADERAPELMLVRSLASQAESRTMLFVLTDADRPATADSALHFASELGKDPAFDQALFMGDTAARDAMGRELFTRRFDLLFPQWLDEHRIQYSNTSGASGNFPTWLAHQTVRELGQFLGSPEALAFQETVPADPLLLIARTVERLKDSLSLVQPAKGGATAPTLVWARLANSPLSEAGQKPAFDAIARVTSLLRTQSPGFAVSYTGVNRFAAASRARIEHEVTWLNALSLVAVLAVALTFIRQAYRGLHLVPIVLMSTLGAWVCVTLAFERVHILVFVVGSLLTGVAIDYGFYLFMQPPVRPGEDYWEKVHRLAKPLLASCLTTVAGFALLLFSELPFIRQLGVFVGAGLVAALASAVVYFSTVENPFLEARSARFGYTFSSAARKNIRRGLIALWLAALPGMMLLKWKDDIRELEISSPALKQEDARINALFGDQINKTVYLTYGNTLGEARTSLEKLSGWLKKTGGSQTRTIGLSPVIPTEKQYENAIEFTQKQKDFPILLRDSLEQSGFDGAEFAPFFDAYAEYSSAPKPEGLAIAVQSLQTRLVGPMSLLAHTGTGSLNWFVTLVQDAPEGQPPAEAHTVTTGQLQSLNRIFSRYRQSALWLSLIGLAIVGAGVFASYGWRDGARIFAIPCGACLGLFGLAGWLGHPLNLFHLLGAFLGVCLTHNYSIFSATSAYRHEAPPVSVRMSAFTTAASFGVLALSGIPVVRALGSTVSLMVIAALLLIEFEHLSALGKKS